jgi:hypothetical protein
MPSIGIMVQVMEPSAAISQDMRHIMPGIMPPIGIRGIMPGIILPIMGIAAVLVIQLSHSLIGNPPASPLGRRKG